MITYTHSLLVFEYQT